MIWPSNGNEAGGDLVLIQTSLVSLCKSVLMDKPHAVQWSKLIVNLLPQPKQLTIYTSHKPSVMVSVNSTQWRRGVWELRITKQFCYLFNCVNFLCFSNVASFVILTAGMKFKRSRHAQIQDFEMGGEFL